MTPETHTAGPGPADVGNAGKPPAKTHSVHIRGVPEQVWRRARTNALLSGLPFKEYVTLLLARCDPVPPGCIPSGDPEDGSASVGAPTLETKPLPPREAQPLGVTNTQT